ncbi:MAG: GNAT family N-acetyltransferase [Jaaginema sp. PMC 1079.18]|nr:GNAT family N-acetyltransferase [Jaaginema sp. PMC 1080.18]MEC4851124.1 GNAT family N-acetyltransferase [Jaaginema sp. PMC 1079.18]MEC4868240.1 GNAT family N-acetyltransferase [Jaaginema sp. PMC 1078.18]
MTEISVRYYEEDTDLSAIAHLVQICDRFDNLPEEISLESLQRDLNNPQLDRQNNVRLWEDANGELIGYAWLGLMPPKDKLEGFLWFRIHPQARDTDLPALILTWAETRLHTQAPNYPLCLRIHATENDTYRHNLLSTWGFTLTRYFFSMSRSLLNSIPQPQLPQPFYLRTCHGESEILAIQNLYNQSFADHWNFHPLPLPQLRYEFNSPLYRPDLNLLAVAPDGTLVAFCFSKILSDTSTGEIVVLGTIPAYRCRGLGRSLLLHSLQRLQAAAAITAQLGVDADNRAGAVKLYTNIGFERDRTTLYWFKTV